MIGIAEHTAKVGGLGFVVGLVVALAGCGGSAPEPAQLGRFRPTPAVNVILDSLGVAEEPAVAWENGEDPKPRDLVADRSDDTLHAGDVVRVSIFELLQEGVTTVHDYTVSETGNISIPDVGLVQAGGLTAVQLEQQIKRLLAPAILKNPSVSVTLVQSPRRTFAVLGAGVKQPGRFVIPRHDYRLSDALAEAGGVAQFNVSSVYVSRAEESAQPETGEPPARELELLEPQPSMPEPKSQTGPVIPPPTPNLPRVPPSGVPRPSEPAEKFETQQEMMELIAPSAKAKPKTQGGETTLSYSALPQFPNTPLVTRQPSSGQADVTATELPGGYRLFMPKGYSGPPAPSREEIIQAFSEFGGIAAALATKPPAEATGDTQFIFENGKWVPVPGQGGGRKTDDKEPVARIPGFGFGTADSNEDAKSRSSPTAAPKAADEKSEWLFKDGRWVQVKTGISEPAKPPIAAPPAGATLPIENEKPQVQSAPDRVTHNRPLKIPVDRLLAGDQRYNVIIKPGDVIHVPADVVGEFCITGNVVRGGYINMTGRPMTLMQAVAEAQGLSTMAWPQYCEIVRRVGEDEEIVMVDLQRISQGKQPDVFIKPNDLINVGTHPSPEWRTNMRNAQKPACGLVFEYDRNFSDKDYGVRQPGRP